MSNFGRFNFTSKYNNAVVNNLARPLKQQTLSFFKFDHYQCETEMSAPEMFCK